MLATTDLELLGADPETIKAAKAERKVGSETGLQPYTPRLQPYAPRLQPYAPRLQPYAPRLQPFAPRWPRRRPRRTRGPPPQTCSSRQLPALQPALAPPTHPRTPSHTLAHTRTPSHSLTRSRTLTQHTRPHLPHAHSCRAIALAEQLAAKAIAAKKEADDAKRAAAAGGGGAVPLPPGPPPNMRQGDAPESGVAPVVEEGEGVITGAKRSIDAVDA